MPTQISCAYTATATGSFTPAELAALFASVPLDDDFLVTIGLRVLSDTTGAPVGDSVTRTIVLDMEPTITATVTATLFGGDPTGSPIDTLSFTSGLGYVVPPVLLPDAPTVSGRTAALHATLGVVSVNPILGGALYTGQTTLVFSGGDLAPGGTQATATPTIVLGVITGVVMTDIGGPYNTPPDLVAVDPGGGSGATFLVQLGLSGAVLDDPGLGYSVVPAVTVVPLFKSLFPDGTDQGSPVANWMTEVFLEALSLPVIAAVPVVT
jgi:hypothetical protein